MWWKQKLSTEYYFTYVLLNYLMENKNINIKEPDFFHKINDQFYHNQGKKKSAIFT